MSNFLGCSAVQFDARRWDRVLLLSSKSMGGVVASKMHSTQTGFKACAMLSLQLPSLLEPQEKEMAQ